MFKAALIGAGMIAGTAHVPAYRSCGDAFSVEAVADLNEAAARDMAGKYGIPRYYTDCARMLEEVRPDVVSVCVPNAFHKQYVRLALEHGANVLCEKPVAVTYADAVELYELAWRQNRVLMACQSMRYTPDRLALKAMIDRGEVGDVYYAAFQRIRRRGIPTWGTFHMKRFSGGGAMIDLGVHMLDAMLWLLGNPEIVSVSGSAGIHHAAELGDLVSSGARTGTVDHARRFRPEEMDVEDFAAGSILFRNGATAQFISAWAANLPESSEIRVTGQRSGVVIPEGLIYSGDTPPRPLEIRPDPYGAEAFPGHFHIMHHLARVLRGEAAPEITPAQTIQVSAVLDLFYRAAARKQSVAFEELTEETSK